MICGMKRLLTAVPSAAAIVASAFCVPAAHRADAAPAAAGRFVCTATKVHDGDGPIWCAERGVDGKPIKVRLTAIAAREIDGTCSPGHPCPRASGAAARDALARLALGRRLRCEATGVSYGRVTAWCWTPSGVELNCAMVKSGTALRWDKYDRRRRLCRR
jgi:endonuclease YncB( thermonuclease family)